MSPAPGTRSPRPGSTTRTAREDLAAMLLDQLDDDRFVRRIVAVATPGMYVSAAQTFRREILKR